MLDDLVDLGYVVAELAGWVGPTSAEAAQARGQVVAQPGQAGGLQLGQAGLQQVGGQVEVAGLAWLGYPTPSYHYLTPPHLTSPGSELPQPAQPATLTAEEVGLLAQYQVTYQNGRWVHTELTPTGYTRARKGALKLLKIRVLDGGRG